MLLLAFEENEPNMLHDHHYLPVKNRSMEIQGSLKHIIVTAHTVQSIVHMNLLLYSLLPLASDSEGEELTVSPWYHQTATLL